MKKFLCMAALVLLVSIGHRGAAVAVSGSEFQAGRIIDDLVFNDSGSMSQAEIQAFLDSKVPTCDTNGTKPYGGTTRAQYSIDHGYPPPFICLKEYRQDTPDRPAETGLCSALPGGNKSSAQIIKDVSVACGISPKVLIVLLQKEQTLVTDDWPWPLQYRSATGYGCPDTAACDTAYYGFFNQVYNAARQYKLYARSPTSYRYRAGRDNYIQYNPNADCGGTNVYIQNQATAGLYNYTPYQPNASALNNLYGTGDGCGAYGNRNFWRMFNDWFGTTLNDNASADAYAHPDGTLIRYLTDPAIYLVKDGQRRHISSLEIFMSYRYSFGSVKPFTTGDLKLPVGSPITAFAPGTILQQSGTLDYHAVYTNPDNSQSTKLISPTLFSQMGFMASRVIQTSAAQIPISSGALQSTDAHPNGTLIIDASTRVYILENGQKRHIPSPHTLFSYRYYFNDVIAANASDQNLPVGQPMPYAEGQLFIDNLARVFVANITDSGTGELRHIPAPFVFYGLRYNWHEILRQDIDNIPKDSPLQPQA